MLCGSFWIQEHVGECSYFHLYDFRVVLLSYFVNQLCWRDAVWWIYVCQILKATLLSSIFPSDYITYNGIFNFSISSFCFTFFCLVSMLELNGKLEVSIFMFAFMFAQLGLGLLFLRLKSDGCDWFVEYEHVEIVLICLTARIVIRM